MHQQIKASPDDTATNVQRVVNALAKAGINIEALAPDFEPPHVRVLAPQGQRALFPPDPEQKAMLDAVSQLGILMLLSLYVMSVRGKLPTERSETVEIVGLYWHFVDVVWILIFTVVYLIK